MQRRGKPVRWRKSASLAIRPEKVQRPMPLEEVIDSGQSAEIEKIGAAAHGYVLAMVDRFAGCSIDVGSCTPAKLPAGLEQIDTAAVSCQCGRGSHPGKTAPDDCDTSGH